MRDEKIKQQEIDLNDLIKSICLRPRMYVGNEDFRMIASFIDGFDLARGFRLTMEFSWWLGVKFKKPRNVAWWCNLKEIYPNDEDVLRELPILFEEFCNSEKDYSDDKFFLEQLLGRTI